MYVRSANKCNLYTLIYYEILRGSFWSVDLLCLECEQMILRHVHVDDKFETAQGLSFAIKAVEKGKMFLETSIGGSKWFHTKHAAACLHWMRIRGNAIEGVGSTNKNSVRMLVGRNGILAQCQKCEWNVAYIWGILRGLPQVHRGEGNKLFIP